MTVLSSKKQSYLSKKEHRKKFKIVPHRFDKKCLSGPWHYCSGCGLLALNNDVTRKSMRRPCNSMEE